MNPDKTFDNQIVRIVLEPGAKCPSKGTPDSAGFDLYAQDDYQIAPFDRTIIKTGVRFELPPGTYGKIEPRSGLDHSCN